MKKIVHVTKAIGIVLLKGSLISAFDLSIE